MNDQNNTTPNNLTAPPKKVNVTGELVDDATYQKPNDPQVGASSTNTSTVPPVAESVDTQPERAASAILKLLAIVGLIGLLALATWLSVQIIRYTPTAIESLSSVSFSSFFSPGENEEHKISFALDTLTYQSGRPFTLAWENGNETVSRDYTFTYSCAPGVSFKVLRGTEVVEVACDEPFTFSTMANQLVVVPHSENNRYIDTTITLARADDPMITTSTTLNLTNEQLTDSPDVLVDNGMRDDDRPVDTNTGGNTTSENGPETSVPTQPSAPATPAPVPPQPSQPQTIYVPNSAAQSNPSGQPDLAVTILESGIVTTFGGKEKFVAVSPIPSDQRVGVRFSVENIGNRTSSDDWYFVATLPLEGDTNYTYRSPRQQALGPTDRMEFTLKFDDITTKGNATVRLSIEGESTDRVEQNNTTQKRLTVTKK